jgi:hypothetical protein
LLTAGLLIVVLALIVFVPALKKSALEHSMDDLINYGPESSFIYRNFGQDDLETILSGRHSIEMLHSIERLSKKDRAAACRLLFDKAYKAHTNAFCGLLKHVADPSYAAVHPNVGATKMALSTALFATADLGRRDLLSGQFAQLDDFRCEFTARWTTLVSAHPQMGVFTLETYLPDNRLQVNILRLAAARAAGSAGLLQQFDAECRLARMKTNALPVADWDSREPPYERIIISGLFPSRGWSNYMVYEWEAPDFGRDNEREDGVVSKLRSIVLH